MSMHNKIAIILLVFAALILAMPTPAEAVTPQDFPQFIVPGFEEDMSALRDLYWEHYSRGGPMATLWDEWLLDPTIWPAVTTDNRMQTIRQRWRNALAGRIIDSEGYVATHQHPSIAHQLGWPFPFWNPAFPGSWGWHFSLAGIPNGWHQTTAKTQEGWTLTNGKDAGISDAGWVIELNAPRTSIEPPALTIDVLQSPFIQIRWAAHGLADTQPFIEWKTKDNPDYSPERRMYFTPVESDKAICTMIPVFRHPGWAGEITSLRIRFNNPVPGASVKIESVFTQYDTRHNINNPCFIKGCIHYFLWTQDYTFLRGQIQRMRLALHYLMTECKGLEEKCIVTPFVGHCGRSGIQRDADGTKHMLPGRGIGNNYWDLLPFGRRDAYATMQYYDALLQMADLERMIASHPEWNIPAGPLRLNPDQLEQHALEVKAANRAFWNPETGRFTLGIDDDGNQYDYGYTFMNLESVYYDFALKHQADSIMSWIAGKRIVEADTSQGEDIYHWRFAPRATTKRNIDYYGWFWTSPESIPWGGQVQDGGAVLGFSYHDLMARLKILGPDDAWSRLHQIITWYREVQAAGGPRVYYAEPGRGSLQGGGTAGGLGIDKEFFESVMVPQVILHGFLGFEPTATGFRIDPQLPSDWPELTVDRIHIHDRILTIRATHEEIEITCVSGAGNSPTEIYLPTGIWAMGLESEDGSSTRSAINAEDTVPVNIGFDWHGGQTIRCTRIPQS